jgi:hypothetical protein
VLRVVCAAASMCGCSLSAGHVSTTVAGAAKHMLVWMMALFGVSCMSRHGLL